MTTASRTPLVLRLAGFIAMIVGAADPMEGSILILIGSALTAVGFFLARAEPRVVGYWVSAFLFTLVGVAALWGLSAVGGVGGSSGHSPLWLVLVLPYLGGWIMIAWGEGTPRWFPWLTIGIGLWWLAIPTMIVVQGAGRSPMWWTAPIAIGVLGLITIAGGAARLRKPAA